MRPLPKSKPLVPRGENFGLVVLSDFYSLANEYMKQRRRIIPRFGLRSILVLTAIVAAICGGWLVQARRQRDACAQLESVGVELRMEDPAVWLRWLPQYILNYDGGHYFCPVTEADLWAVHGGPSPLIPLLAQLPQLRVLRIDQESFGSESISGLARCSGLESLDLSHGDFDDECLSQLPRMPRLKSLDLTNNYKCSKPNLQLPQLDTLNLWNTQANDETLSQVAKLTQLRWLSLDSTPVSDAGIASLRRLKKLETLELNSTSTTGESVAGIRSLRSLSLRNTLLEDRNFAAICEMPSLENLDVGGCRGITDAALVRLVNNKTLQSLNLSGCRRISQDSVDTISQIATLKSLSIDGTGITALTKLERLSQLNNLSHSIDEVEIEELLSFSDQVRLSLTGMADRGNSRRNPKIVLDGIAGLCAKHFMNLDPDVERLSLSGSRFESEIFWVINSWPKLKSAIKFLTCCYDRQIKLVDFDLPFHFGNSGDVQMGWMLGRSPFDPDLSHINLLGPLIDNRKLQDFEPSSNCEFVSAIGVSCDPERLIDKLITCPNLYALTLRRIPLSIEAIAKFKHLKLLRRLQLTECGLNDSHLPILAGLSQVEELILDSNQIEGQQLDRFTGAMQLDLLSLRMNPLTSNARRTAGQLAKQSRWLRIVR